MITFEDTSIILTKLLLKVSDAAGKKCALSSMREQLKWLSHKPPEWKRIALLTSPAVFVLLAIMMLIYPETRGGINILLLIAFSAGCFTIERSYSMSRRARVDLRAMIDTRLSNQTVSQTDVNWLLACLRLEYRREPKNLRFISNAHQIWMTYVESPRGV